eukprot:scaffold1867_cov247-Pinguiococcus_pyrenoidosus.AAC.17
MRHRPHALAGLRPGAAPVSNLHHEVARVRLVNEEVVRLQIPVDEGWIPGVQVHHALCHVAAHLQLGLIVEMDVVIVEHLPQVAPGAELRSDPDCLHGQAATVQVQNLRMAEHCHDSRLANDLLQELVALLGVSLHRSLRKHELLHGHGTVAPRPPPHPAEASLAYHAFQDNLGRVEHRQVGLVPEMPSLHGTLVGLRHVALIHLPVTAVVAGHLRQRRAPRAHA